MKVAVLKFRTDGAPKRGHANERKRRYRQRQRAGISIAPTPVSNEIIALLIDTGWLALAESEDVRRVGEAIFKMLSDAAKRERVD